MGRARLEQRLLSDEALLSLRRHGAVPTTQAPFITEKSINNHDLQYIYISLSLSLHIEKVIYALCSLEPGPAGSKYYTCEREPHTFCRARRSSCAAAATAPRTFAARRPPPPPQTPAPHLPASSPGGHLHRTSFCSEYSHLESQIASMLCMLQCCPLCRTWFDHRFGLFLAGSCNFNSIQDCKCGIGTVAQASHADGVELGRVELRGAAHRRRIVLRRLR